MEIKTITCPNCGANTTNAQNCEYCGSLLVRFVDKGIDLSKTSYANDTATFPGLTAELKRNLKLQEKNPDEGVLTELCTKNEEAGIKETISIFRSGYCLWWDDKDIDISESTNGLIISVGFQTYIDDDEDSQEFNQRQEKLLEAFKKLNSFPLFTSHICNYIDDYGYERYCREYAIDFGNDAEGAARLVSEILQKMYGWTMDTHFDMYTEVGDDIDDARDSWNRAHGFAVDEDEDDSEEYDEDGSSEDSEEYEEGYGSDESNNSNKFIFSLLKKCWWVIVFIVWCILRAAIRQ